MNYKAIIHPTSDGGYWAEVPELPGLVTEGDTLDELYANLEEAVQGWLEADAKRKRNVEFESEQTQGQMITFGMFPQLQALTAEDFKNAEWHGEPDSSHFYFRATDEEFKRAFDAIGKGNESLPQLPPEAFERESIYEDEL